MKFSRKTDYGVLLTEALRPSFLSGGFISLAAIAEDGHLPVAFIAKLADELRRAGLVEARRGSAGGYRLIKDPKTITLKQLIDIFEEPKMMRCMQSSDPKKYCALASICPTRKTWRDIEGRVNKIFEEVTVDTL